jgi:hypothetical protein
MSPRSRLIGSRWERWASLSMSPRSRLIGSRRNLPTGGPRRELPAQALSEASCLFLQSHGRHVALSDLRSVRPDHTSRGVAPTCSGGPRVSATPRLGSVSRGRAPTEPAWRATSRVPDAPSSWSTVPTARPGRLAASRTPSRSLIASPRRWRPIFVPSRAGRGRRDRSRPLRWALS